MEKEKLIQGGSLTEAKQVELEQTRRICERLLSTVTSLAELLIKEIPKLEVCYVLCVLYIGTICISIVITV
mgnify:CR=1 FL=1